MTETTARTYHTMESLRQMAQTDLRNVNRKELVDINEVEIRTAGIKFDGKDEISSDFLHLKTTDLGLSFCLGYQLHNGLFLNGGYYLGLTDIDPNKDFDWKNHGFSIKVGYMFSR